MSEFSPFVTFPSIAKFYPASPGGWGGDTFNPFVFFETSVAAKQAPIVVAEEPPIVGGCEEIRSDDDEVIVAVIEEFLKAA